MTAASLARLNQPAEEPAFQEHVQFHLRHFPRFTTRPEQIRDLRQTILNLAVVGKLTDNRYEGLSAPEEMKTVEIKKQQLALRKQKSVDAVTLDEQWCVLPERWAWARWEQITDWITYGFTRPMPHEAKGIPVITGKNVNYRKIIFETAHRTTIEAFNDLNPKDRPCVGDLLVTKDGSIGRTAIVDVTTPFCINQSVTVLWLRCCHFNRRFLQLALDCSQTQDVFIAKSEGVAIKHISVVDLGKMVFPLPPLAEQNRIVAKVDELMAVCDRLEGQLTATQTQSQQLLEAVLHEALAAAA